MNARLSELSALTASSSHTVASTHTFGGLAFSTFPVTDGQRRYAMRVVGGDGKLIKPLRVERERRMYELIRRNSELLESSSQFRLLTANKGPEKGPDFIGVNRRGQLVLGEIKAGPLRADAWRQVKGYANRFRKMRKQELERHIIHGGMYSSLDVAGRNLLSSTAKRALLNPSLRRLQLVLVAESFSDRVLEEIRKKGRKATIRRFVKDVKCVEMQVFKIRKKGTIATVTVIAGRARRLRK